MLQNACHRIAANLMNLMSKKSSGGTHLDKHFHEPEKQWLYI